MPPKKKAAKNGFSFFMQDVRRREESRGNTFRDCQQVAEFCGPLWAELSPDEKDVYNKLAAQHKKRNEGDDLSNKFTSLGVSFAVVDAEKKEEEEAHNVMVKTVRNTINCLNWESTLRTFRYFLCHANYYYKTDTGNYAIAELGFAEFSLEQGVINTLHFFVDPGEFPLGYRYAAIEWSRKTHGIPCGDPNWRKGEKDYYSLFTRVKAFLLRDNSGVFPPVYTVDDSLNNNTCMSAVKSALANLCDAANEDVSLFRVYPLNQLFFELRNKCGEGPDPLDEDGANLVPSLAIINSEIERDVFSYARDLGCEYHEEQDLALHCSLSIVTRWVYTICDHCCKHVRVPLIPGRHCPKDTDVSGDFKVARKARRDEKYNKTESKPDPKTQNCVMPTIIDHGKIKEIEEIEKRQPYVNIPKEEEVRLPKKALGGYAGAAKYGSSSQQPVQIDSNFDFPAIGDQPSYRSASRGRGIMNRNNGGSLSQDFPKNPWSVGRGSRLK